MSIIANQDHDSLSTQKSSYFILTRNICCHFCRLRSQLKIPAIASLPLPSLYVPELHAPDVFRTHVFDVVHAFQAYVNAATGTSNIKTKKNSPKWRVGHPGKSEVHENIKVA